MLTSPVCTICQRRKGHGHVEKPSGCTIWQGWWGHNLGFVLHLSRGILIFILIKAEVCTTAFIRCPRSLNQWDRTFLYSRSFYWQPANSNNSVHIFFFSLWHFLYFQGYLHNNFFFLQIITVYKYKCWPFGTAIYSTVGVFSSRGPRLFFSF